MLLPGSGRVVFWAILAGVCSMGIYAVTSPQRRLTSLAEATKAAQNALSTYQGEFAGALPLIRRLFGTALTRLGLVLAPSLLAGLPVIVLLAWLDARYGAAEPQPGETVVARVAPAITALRWQPQDAAELRNGNQWHVRWPSEAESVRLLTADGDELLSIPGPTEARVVRRNWWHALFGSVALPAESPIDSVTFDYAPREVMSVGPSWARGYLAIFLCATCVASLAVKFAFRLA
jgi:hypothetical protein